MNTNQQQKTGEKKLKEEEKESQSAAAAAAAPALSPLPPSPSSSPSHEFSFTLSLHPTASDKSKAASPPSYAVDLSPADDIFFHGHLLPLHLLAHLSSSSPRSSINSMDSFTIPIKDIWDTTTTTLEESHKGNASTAGEEDARNKPAGADDDTSGRNKSKAASFSLFGFTKWRKGYEGSDQTDQDTTKAKHKRKLGFDVLKRYARVVRPLLFFRGRKENMQIHRKAYSFSGNLSLRNKQEVMRGRRGEFSAPASMRTSPTNSGLLVATSPSTVSSSSSSSTSDSTMEELQSAIQAAIAHCKNSIAKEEKTTVKSS